MSTTEDTATPIAGQSAEKMAKCFIRKEPVRGILSHAGFLHGPLMSVRMINVLVLQLGQLLNELTGITEDRTK
jgi:hypothetical protein